MIQEIITTVGLFYWAFVLILILYGLSIRLNVKPNEKTAEFFLLMFLLAHFGLLKITAGEKLKEELGIDLDI